MPSGIFECRGGQGPLIAWGVLAYPSLVGGVLDTQIKVLHIRFYDVKKEVGSFMGIA